MSRTGNSKGNRTLFLCGKCGAILSATASDFSGFSKSKVGLLTNAGLFNAVGKKVSGKSVATTYIKLKKLVMLKQQKYMKGKKCQQKNCRHLPIVFNLPNVDYVYLIIS